MLATVGMIVWIGSGATALAGVYNLMGGIHFVSNLIIGISDNPTVIVLLMMLILFVLGAFLDWVGIALLTMPQDAPSRFRSGAWCQASTISPRSPSSVQSRGSRLRPSASTTPVEWKRTVP